jgi:hypothetical protein
VAGDLLNKDRTFGQVYKVRRELLGHGVATCPLGA